MTKHIGSLAAATAALSLSALGCNLARFDGSDPLLAEIQKEIKQFGTDHKGLKDSMSKDLAELRSLVDGVKNNQLSPELKAQLEGLSASVATKQGALETSLKSLQDQQDALDVAFKRLPAPGVDGKAEEKSREDAIKHFETILSLKGSLNPMNRDELLQPDKLDLAGYKLWEKQFDRYLRANDDRSLDVKALSVGSNPDGGYLVPTARSARIIQKIYETSPMRSLASIETIGTSELELPIDTDEAAVGWVGETQARPTTNTPQVGVQKIPVHELYAKPRATQKFLEDASINVEAWLADKIADKMARTEATAFLIGNGINQPRGILSYTPTTNPALVGRGTPLTYNSGGATTVTADAIVALPFMLKSAYLPGSSWLMKRSSVMAMMLLKDGQGQYLWRPGLTVGGVSSLGGFDVNMADDMPAIAAGVYAVAFGNWKRAYTIVDRLGITTLRDPYSAKPFVEFYSRKRVGGDVVDFDAYVTMTVSL